MKKILFFLLALIAINTQAQRNCGSMSHLQDLISADPQLVQKMQEIENHTAQTIANGSPKAIVTIPVVFHVIYKSTADNISDARIMAQLDVLNKDYARLNSDASNTPSAFQGVSSNTNIQFCLASQSPTGAATTGIVRKTTTVTSFSSNDAVKYSAQGGDDAWPSSSYLNIWVCNLGGGLLGYAQFPGGAAATDGVVLLAGSVGGPTAVGTSTPYHLGRTATHEVGHWLNLRHIWGDASCGSDLVTDTPTQQTSNYGCPTFPHVTCSNGANGDMFMNYMDYTDDGCMNMFTNGQTSRMQALFAAGGSRASLTSSTGCGAVTTPSCGIPSGLAPSNVTASSSTVSWTALSGATSYNVRYKATASTTWTSTSTTSTSISLSGLSASTAYECQVQGNCSGTLGTYSSSTTFTTLSSGGGTTPTTVNVTVGTATTTSGNTPYGTYYMDHRAQYIITQAELVAAGYTSANNIIRNLSFYATTASTQSMGSFTIKISNTTSSSFSSTSYLTASSPVTVYSGTFTATANNWSVHNFTTPFTYNGTSNLLVEICWDNSTYTTDTQVRYSATTAYRALYKRQDAATTGICTTTTGTRSYNRPNMRFGFSNTTARMEQPELVSSNETEALAQFQIFPNPTNDVVNILYPVMEDGQNANIMVYNAMGQLVANINKGVSQKGNYIQTLNLTSEMNLSTGIYICTLQLGDSKISKRFIIQKD